MPFATVKQSGPDIPDGVYPVILTAINGDPQQPDKPKTVTAQRGPNAGQDIELWDWIFAIDSGEFEGTELSSSTSTASGPRSKMYAYLTALFGGRAPTVGTTFEKGDLIGRYALATIRKDESGWPRIENLGAMPADMLGARVAKATNVPTNQPVAAGTPLRQAVAAGAASDDLPF